MDQTKNLEREEEKFLETSPHGSRILRLAQIISLIANPLLVTLPLTLIVAVVTAPDATEGLLWWGITAIGASVAPLLFIWRGVRRGRYTDHHVSRREQRLVPLLFAIGSMILIFVFLLVLKASSALLATVIALIASGAIALMITQFARWKISLHMVGMAGAVTTLGVIVGPLLFSLAPLIILVGWARWKVRAHTPLQAVAGGTLAIGVTLVTFWLFGVL